MKKSVLAVLVTGALGMGLIVATAKDTSENSNVASSKTPTAVAQPEESRPMSPEEVGDNQAIWTLSHSVFSPLGRDIIPAVAKVVKDESAQMWLGGQAAKGTSTLTVTIHSDTPYDGQVTLAFFMGNSWLPNPVQLRKTDQRQFKVENLTAGEYWIAALHGDSEKPDLLGVNSTWPKHITVGDNGNAATADVLLSASVARNITERLTYEQSLLPKKEEHDPKTVVMGYVRDQFGNGIPNAQVYIQEVGEASRGKDVTTDETGYYFCSGVTWPYTIGALRYILRPDKIAYCWQYVGYPEIHNRPEQIDIALGKLETTRETLRGTVVFDDGTPCNKYAVSICSAGLLATMFGPDPAKTSEQIGWSQAVFSKNGNFEVEVAPKEKYDITVDGFAFQGIEYNARISAPAHIVLNKRYPRYVRVIRNGRPLAGASLKIATIDWTPSAFRSDANGLVKAMFTKQEIQEVETNKKVIILAPIEGSNRLDSKTFPGSVLRERAENAQTVDMTPAQAE